MRNNIPLRLNALTEQMKCLMHLLMFVYDILNVDISPECFLS